MKNPAVLLYTSDFITGTIFMSNEEVGAYIRLLCIQHQKGHLKKEEMIQICKSEEIFNSVIIHFEQDENKLPNDTFFDSNHKLYQNRALNKTFKYYYLDYQYIVKDPVYSTFYDTTNKEVLHVDNNILNFESFYIRKTYYIGNNKIRVFNDENN